MDKRADIINRIENLTEEQFDLLITYLQQAEESDPVYQVPHLTSA